jgi:hypothetical protein
MDLTNWTMPDPAEVHHPGTDEQWAEALSRYLGSHFPNPFLRCVDVARRLGAVTVVIETRYMDLDFRSEFSSFYSKQFADIPDSTHRLHFFKSHLTEKTMWNKARKQDYLGYIVVRPISTGLVSRALLPPPPKLRDAIRTAVTETVNLFGQDLEVTGVPFSQQDAQMGACAQAAAWMCHFSAHLRGEVPRRPRADFTLKAPVSLNPRRPFPSRGLTAMQLNELFRQFELPALHYEVGNLPSTKLAWQPADPVDGDPSSDHRIVAVACRHLNSGMPVLVGTQTHAFVLCGYRRTRRDGQSWIEFVRHDDQVGPYTLVSDVLHDVAPDSGRYYGAWSIMQVPMHEKIWLAPEVAELKGAELLAALSRQVSAAYPEKPFLDLDELIKKGRLRAHTYVIRSNQFKRHLADRGVSTNARRAYAFARLPRYIWVVEAIDKRLRDKDKPCVLGEAVLDATSPDEVPRVLAGHIHGAMGVQSTSGLRKDMVFGSFTPYRTGGSGPE